MNIYDFKVKDVNEKEVPLSKYKGKVMLIVNTATHCGFTPQYEGLEKLYEQHQKKGLEILDFPCNQFANQAPESNKEIANFCSMHYKTSFQTFAKIDVNGRKADPLYKYLKKQKGGLLSAIKWNFTKFLVDREGNVVKRFAPNVEPAKLEDDIKELLHK
jgi:glutathione peroxidase